MTRERAHLNPLARPGSYVVLTVSDTGVGIPPDVINRIFDPFFTTKPVGEGTGLGLSTVLGIVKNHGGFVTVDSEPGHGTTFKVYLPAADAPETVPGGAEPAVPRGRDDLILVIDDEAPIREATRAVLERHGYRVVSAANGEEGLRTFVQYRDTIQLVLTDMMMPVMNGVDMIRSVRVLEPKVRIIATSGLDEPNRRDELAALNVSEILIKPCDPVKLLQALHRALASG